jgi:uncharacterized protein (DUF1697 family)
MATMHTYISLLRGINVSGQKLIKMAELKALYESLRFANVTTYIQSGNVVFQSRSDDPLSIGTSIEKAIEKALGFSVTVILRRPAELRRIINKSPLPGGGEKDQARLYVTFLKERPKASLVKAITAVPARTADTYEIAGSEVYIHCPNGFGKTLFSNNFFEKHLQTVATTRNWRTVQTLLSLSRGSDRSEI